MLIWFLLSVIGVVATTPLHFFSVEHVRLQERFGSERGTKIGDILGLISGWGFSFFWLLMWVSPQPRFTLSLPMDLAGWVLKIDAAIPLLHLIIAAPFLIAGCWLGIKGVKETTLRVAETHRPYRVITAGAYSSVRHPQYLGGLLSHVGISFLLSSLFSILSTPLMVVLIYLMARKEEQELVREFGDEYEEYRKRVPMLIPRPGRR